MQNKNTFLSKKRMKKEGRVSEKVVTVDCLGTREDVNIINTQYYKEEDKMKKLKKRTRQNPSTLEQYSYSLLPCGCSCFCGPGGFPWAQARDSLNRSEYLKP